MNKLVLVFLSVISFSFNCLESEQVCSTEACYNIIEELGSGAFGTVYHVKDTNNQDFALKRYISGTTTGYMVCDVDREFHRGQIFDHDNIIKSFDIFVSPDETNPIYNVVLQFVNGKTIWNTNSNAFSEESALKIINQLCDGLNYALNFDMFHMDLHLNNVMLDNRYNLVIIDLASFITFEEIYDAMVRFASGDLHSDTDSTFTSNPLTFSDHTDSSSLNFSSYWSSSSFSFFSDSSTSLFDTTSSSSFAQFGRRAFERDVFQANNLRKVFENMITSQTTTDHIKNARIMNFILRDKELVQEIHRNRAEQFILTQKSQPDQAEELARWRKAITYSYLLQIFFDCEVILRKSTMEYEDQSKITKEIQNIISRNTSTFDGENNHSLKACLQEIQEFIRTE